MPVVFTPKHYKLSRRLRRTLFTLTILFWSSASLLLVVPVLPHILYRLSPSTPQALAQDLGSTLEAQKAKPHDTLPLPPLDTTLPKENYLLIPKIGVDGPINEGTWEESLPKGLWREPGFSAPDSGLPTVIAAHRWGYLNWTNTFRRQNSFLNLPKLTQGDKVEIIWNQRKYTYTIYKSENAETITDYNADLILFTCQYWESPIRVFRYAKRTN